MTHWSHKDPIDWTINRFAEALSITGDVSTASDRIGIARPYGRVLFKRIRKKLGEQAR